MFFDDLFNTLSANATLVASIVMGLVTSALVFGFFQSFSNVRDPVRRRIDSVSLGPQESNEKSAELEIQNRIGSDDDVKLSELHQQFIYAGYRNTRAISLYYLAKLGLTIILPMSSFFLVSYFPSLNSNNLFLIMLVTGAVGFIAPGIFLDQSVKRRQSAILNGFPDMLDLLVSCSEAGLGLNAALQRVTGEISLSYPELAAELHIVNLEMRAGVDRMDALKGLAVRTGIEEISGLVSMLRQSIRFGSGISDTLRIYSEEFRDSRMQKAEAVAGSIGTKMIFPLILCIFPAFFVVAIGPAIINLMEVLGTG